MRILFLALAITLVGCGAAQPRIVAVVRCPGVAPDPVEARLRTALSANGLRSVVRVADSCGLRLTIPQPSPIAHLEEPFAIAASARAIDDGVLVTGTLLTREGDDYAIRSSPRVRCADEACIDRMVAYLARHAAQ